MSKSVLKDLPGKLDVKRHSPSILFFSLPFLSSLFVFSKACSTFSDFNNKSRIFHDCSCFIEFIKLVVNEFNKFNNTEAGILHSIYHMPLK